MQHLIQFTRSNKKKESAHYQGISGKGKFFDSEDCVQTEAKTKNTFDTPLCKAAFLADVQTFYLHLYPPSRLDGGLRMSQYFGMKRDEGVSIGPNLWNTRIYPDTEIFASMLSTITRRPSSRERRAIFQATAGYVHIYTYIYICIYIHSPTLETHVCEDEEKTGSCMLALGTHLPNAIRSRACTRDSDDTRVFVKFAAHSYYIIVMSRRCVNIILMFTWNRYYMTEFVSSSYLH